MAWATRLPAHFGPCELSELGKLVAIRCSELAHYPSAVLAPCGNLDRAAGVQRRRIGPVIRSLERATDPLLRQAGINLDA